MKFKKVLSLALSGLLLVSLSGQAVYAKETEDVEAIVTEETEFVEELENKEVNVNLVIEFTPEEAEAYKLSIQEALDENMESIVNEMMKTKNASKMELMEDLVDEIENVDLDAMFKEDENSTLLEIPLNNMAVSIEDTELELSTDGQVEAGEFESNESVAEAICTQDSVEVVLEDMNELASEAEVVADGNGYDINFKMSFDDLAEGVSEMSDNMSDGSSQKTTCKYPAKVSVGSYVGAGAGRTKVYFNTNIVGCNKHDKDLSSITTKQFAAGNSDCAKSVKLGLVALADTTGFLRAYYSNSINCVIEGMTSAAGDNISNIYCNGKKKSGSHVNCSWFNGIGHSERFHYHVYS